MLIRYYCHVGLQTGYGVAGAETCMALLQAGVDLEIATDGVALPSRFLPLASRIRSTDQLSPAPDVIIVHTLPLDCCRVLRGIERPPGARTIAYTTWEGASPPPHEPFREALESFDEVWVPSQQNRLAFVAGGVHDDVRVVPHPFDDVANPLVAAVRAHRAAQTEPPDVYRFYTIAGWTVRKNPEGVIRAYLRAFSHNEPVELVVHAMGAPPDICARAQIATGLEPSMMPPIRFSHERVSEERIAHFHAIGDCFVSATRGEAWNIPAFDAMLARNHIIVPRGTGSDDFLGGTSAWTYATHPAPAGGEIREIQSAQAPPGHRTLVYMGTQGLTVRADWREPDLAELANLMRRACYENVRRLDDMLQDDMLSLRFGRGAVGQRIKDSLMKGQKL